MFMAGVGKYHTYTTGHLHVNCIKLHKTAYNWSLCNNYDTLQETKSSEMLWQQDCVVVSDKIIKDYTWAL